MWAAEPHLEERKSIGLKVVGFLIVLSFLVYFTKRKIWSNIQH
jgi:ubiquinol-cytochrome c reductase cytochrome b/c1 subunit